MAKESQSFVVAKVFDDPTPNGFINLRLAKHLMSLTQFTDLTTSEKDDLFKLLLLIARKLVSVWKHYQNYISHENNLINNAQKQPIEKGQPVTHVEHSQVLFSEFDEFLVQVKSCLDYLVKIPCIILGRKLWPLRTFGGKGNDVIKALNNNVPEKYSPLAKGVITIVQRARPWLELTIEARDKINHFLDGGINFEYFTVFVVKEAEREHLRVPMWSDSQTIKESLDVCWNNLFKLCEDFVAIFIYFRVKNGYAFFHGNSNMDSIKSPWMVTSDETRRCITKRPGWKKL